MIMKTRIIFLFLAIAIMAVASTSLILAQTADSVVWSLSGPTGTTQSATNSTNVIGDSNSLGPAVGWVVASYNANGQRCNFAPNSWPAGSETDTAAGRYVQFNASAIAGKAFTVKNVSFNYGGAGSTNAVRAQVFYSINNWSTKTLLNTDSPLVAQNSTVSPFAKAINVVVPNGAKFSIRVYPFWVSATAGSSSKYCVLDTVIISGTTAAGTEVEQPQNNIPGQFELAQNYPNPFNPTTQISYSIPKESYVSLKVYNLMGQEVATLISGNQTAGKYTVPFDASRLSSGVYMYRLQAGTSVEVKRMIFMK
jgi:hypothetical protein